MDDGSKELKEYLNNLKPETRKVLLSLEWQNRLSQISKKYSLSEEQEGSLQYEALFVIVGMEPAEFLAENIKNNLQISALLAGQLAEEIQSRVISYIIDTVQKSNVNPQKQTTPNKSATDIKTPTTQTTSKPIHEGVVPVNLPGEEIGDSTKTKEPVPKIVGVPRYTAVALDAEGNPVEPIASKAPAADTNRTYTSPVPPKQEGSAPFPPKNAEPVPKPNPAPAPAPAPVPPKPNTPPAQTKAPTSYVVDPYREPID